MSNVISFKDVSLNFGGVQALKNISFDTQENSLFAIIGPNGAGKTSILNCINGIYKPTSGTINSKVDVYPMIERSFIVCLLYTSPSPRDRQ